jgi:hypothetical protein
MADHITSSLCMTVLRVQSKIYFTNPHSSGSRGWLPSCGCSVLVVPFLDVFMLLRALPPLRTTSFPYFSRTFQTTSTRNDFHFDTHHFVQRLEREGLNRAQAEGIMSAMAEVIDESIRNMTSNMVTRAGHEKVQVPRHHPRAFADLGRSNNTHSRLTLPNSNRSFS